MSDKQIRQWIAIGLGLWCFLEMWWAETAGDTDRLLFFGFLFLVLKLTGIKQAIKDE